MANFNIKKEAEVYLYDTANSAYHRLDIEDLSFSQTFTDKTYPQKTLHEQHKLYEASNIKKANPANFELKIPMINQAALDVIFNLLVDYKTGTSTLNTFDLYIKLPNDVYKLTTCVLTNGTFIIEKLENLKLSVTGQAAKLVRGASVSSIARGTRDFQMLKSLEISIDGTPLSSGLYKTSIELQNDIKWNDYETVNKALSVTNTHNINTTCYPSNFTLSKRILSGSIGQYVTDSSNANIQNWKIGVAIDIKAGNGLTSSNFRGFHLSLANCTFTNRNTVGDLFTQAYDWKMNDNPANLGTKVKLNTLIT